MILERSKTSRLNRTKPPYRRTQSTRNLRAQRFWCYVNQRVNYPIKAALRRLEEDGTFDLGSELDRFCVSFVAMQVAWFGIEQLISSCNCHRIASTARRGNGGVPNVMAERTRQTAFITSAPTVEEAIHVFHSNGGWLTLPTPYCYDLLGNRPDLMRIRNDMFNAHHSIALVFSDTARSGYLLLKNALIQFRELSLAIANS